MRGVLGDCVGWVEEDLRTPTGHKKSHFTGHILSRTRARENLRSGEFFGHISGPISETMGFGIPQIEIVDSTGAKWP